jgi:hypothetical protein
MRQRAPEGSLSGDDPQEIQLAHQEHAAFAREYVAEHPVAGTLSMMLAIPAYTLSKVVRYTPSGRGTDTTPPSLDEMASGYSGMWSGLKMALKGQ